MAKKNLGGRYGRKERVQQAGADKDHQSHEFGT